MNQLQARARGALLILLLPLILGVSCRIPSQSTLAPTTPAPLQSTGAAYPQSADQGAALHAQAAPIPPNLTHYLIQVEINCKQGSFSGRATVDYTNNEQVPLMSLYFRLYPNAGNVYGDGWLTVTQVSLLGFPAKTHSTLLDTILEVELPHPLEPGDNVQIELDFNGFVSRDFGATNTSGYGIYNLSDAVLALAGWFPILAVYDHQGWNLDPVSPIGDPVYSDTALFTVDVTADSDLEIATTGVEVNLLQKEGTSTHRFVSGPARDFFIVASPAFQTFQAETNGTMVKAHFLPGYETAAQSALKEVQEALQIFNKLFGQYPYSELEMVQAPMNIASGVEFPGIFLVRIDLYNDPLDIGFLFTIVHEVAHQWWYSTVGNDVIEEPWLDEALATYSSGLYFEAVRGHEFYKETVKYWQATYDELLDQDRDQAVIQPLAYYAGIDGGRDYAAVVYVKGALALHNLRLTIGDQDFFLALQDYYGKHYMGIGTTADLLEAFKQASDQDLGDFYQQWLYSPSVIPTESPIPTHTSPPTTTLEPNPTPSPVSFAVIGDYGMDNQAEEDVANLIQSWGVDFIITTGDNNYPSGEVETIDTHIGRYFHNYIHPYIGQYGKGADEIRFFPALGNHDLLTDDGQPYFNYFNLPGNERYYDFVWGPVHMFALNSIDSEPNGVGMSSVQANWLREQLATSTSPWQVVYTHYPPYSSAYHGSTNWMRWPFHDWGADTLIAGHDHTYERLLINGFPYFVNGLGGAPIYSFDEIVDGSIVRFNDDHGAMLVQVNAREMIFQFITRTGEVIDHYVINQSP